tara:strand:- start:3717 stop:5069 length:1353 start_codon:yes stop_codon:yes gene_type:complete
MQLLDTLVEERAEVGESQTGLVQRAADEKRDLTETEDQSLKDLTTRAGELDTRIKELRAVQVANLEAAKLRAEVSATDDTENRAIGNVVVTHEPSTYSVERRNVSFFSDLYNSQFNGDIDASDRIRRHRQESQLEQRDGTTASFAGLVVPQYLTDLAAELARSGRPFANQCTNLPLPGDGMTINISRVTTGSTAAVQSTENAAISETDIDDTLLTVDVRTIASGQQISRQAIERGTGVDSLIAADMMGAMAAQLESQIIVGTGGSGQLRGINNVEGQTAVTYTDASPTVAEFWPKLQDAIQGINANRFAPADLILMHPRRLGWLNSALDTTNRPIILPQSNVPQNAMGTGPAAGYGNTGVQIAGVPVVTSGAVPTDKGAGSNEDRVYVVRRSDMLLFEQPGQPALVRYDATAGLNLTATLVAYEYACFIGGRYPLSIATISGTGLVAPSF